MTARRTVSIAMLAGLAVLTSGCGYKDVYSLPLPGGVGGGSGSYTVTAEFADAGNLVPDESCRANDIAIGTITSISVTPDLRAKVVCSIKGSVELPANTTATIETTSLLGEAYVALGPPTGEAPSGRLGHNVPVPDADTHTDPDVEEILGSLSAILNDGDIGDLETITTQLNDALAGHEGDLRALLGNLRTFTGKLNHHRADITNALDALDRLSTTLAAQRRTIGEALDSIPDGVRVLNDQRPALVNALNRLSQLSKIGTRVIHASQANTVADLKALTPTLAGLAKDGKDIASALELIPDFPFPRNALASIKGDYSGFYGSISLSLDSLNTLLKQQGASGLPTTRIKAPAPNTQPAPAPVGEGLNQVLNGLLGVTTKVTHRLPKSLRKVAKGLGKTLGELAP